MMGASWPVTHLSHQIRVRVSHWSGRWWPGETARRPARASGRHGRRGPGGSSPRAAVRKQSVHLLEHVVADLLPRQRHALELPPAHRPPPNLKQPPSHETATTAAPLCCSPAPPRRDLPRPGGRKRAAGRTRCSGYAEAACAGSGERAYARGVRQIRGGGVGAARGGRAGGHS
jgi:hypothetical protein